MDSSAFSWLCDIDLEELELEESAFQCDFVGSSLDVEDQTPDFENNDNNNKLHQMINISMMPMNDFPAGLDPNINAPIINNLQFGGKSANSPGQLQQQQVIKELSAEKKRRARPASQTYHHIVAERKRREQLSQRFVILSTIVPGLKKMDKTSVLGDAIKYLKHLQERVNSLEEQTKQQTMEPRVVLVTTKSQVVADDDEDDETDSSLSSERPLPVIKARVLCNNRRLITIRIQCEKKRGVLVNLLSKIEKLNLVVVNTNVLTFAGFVHDITVTAQMEQEFKLTLKEAEKQLRSSLKN